MNISEILSESAYNNAVKNLSDISDMLSVKPIVIFGSGNIGKKVANVLQLKNYKVVAFSDNNEKKWGDHINNIPILQPSEAAELYGTDSLFIVSIWSPGHSYAITKQQLSNIGVKNIIHGAAIMQLFPELLLPHFHFQTPGYFFQHKKELEEVYNFLADEESKKQYIAHIDCRINLNFEGLPAADTQNQYFPSGIIKLTENEIFFDAGAYDGDTLQDFCKRTSFKFDKYIALEPDPENRIKLEKRIQSLDTKNIEVYPFAVGSANCILKFNATGGPGAGISDNGIFEVDCVKIDDKFYNQRLTYLKFDIEGAEFDALCGGEKTIEKYKPKLAVCLYHLPNDPWNIPLYLKNKFPFYNFFVRTHHVDGFEFVLYAIPQ